MVLQDFKIGGTPSVNCLVVHLLFFPQRNVSHGRLPQGHNDISSILTSSFRLFIGRLRGCRIETDRRFLESNPRRTSLLLPGRQASNEKPEAEGVEMENPEGAEGGEA